MTLQITIKNATNLPRTDEGGRGKIDPYFKVNFAGQTYQTQIYQNDLNPNFNETFTFNDSPAKDQLVFELYDDNGDGTSTLISQYVISSDALPTGVAALPLNRLSTNTPCGQVNIEIVHIAAPRGGGRGSQSLVPPVVVVGGPQSRGNVVVQAVPPPVVVAPPAQKSLQITIIEAKNLPLLSGGGGGGRKKGDKIDPFIKVTFGKQFYQTKIFQNELNPRFNETFTFQDSPKRDKVIFELCNNDGGAGQVISTYVLDSDKIPTGKATLPLQTPQGVACGQIDLEIVHLQAAPAPVVVAPPAQKSLQITIIEAKNLPLLSGGGGGGRKKGDKIDPFIKVTFGKQFYQTKIFQNELNPRFNETFTFQDSPKRDKVIFELCNNDGGAGQVISTYVLDSDKIPTGKATLPLQTPQGVACGQIDLEIVHLEALSAPQVVVQPQTVVVQPGRGGPQPQTVVVQPARGGPQPQTVIVQPARGGPQPQTVIVQGGPVKAGRK